MIISSQTVIHFQLIKSKREVCSSSGSLREKLFRSDVCLNEVCAWTWCDTVLSSKLSGAPLRRVRPSAWLLLDQAALHIFSCNVDVD